MPQNLKAFATGKIEIKMDSDGNIDQVLEKKQKFSRADSDLFDDIYDEKKTAKQMRQEKRKLKRKKSGTDFVK